MGCAKVILLDAHSLKFVCWNSLQIPQDLVIDGIVLGSSWYAKEVNKKVRSILSLLEHADYGFKFLQ